MCGKQQISALSEPNKKKSALTNALGNTNVNYGCMARFEVGAL